MDAGSWHSCCRLETWGLGLQSDRMLTLKSFMARVPRGQPSQALSTFRCTCAQTFALVHTFTLHAVGRLQPCLQDASADLRVFHFMLLKNAHTGGLATTPIQVLEGLHLAAGRPGCAECPAMIMRFSGSARWSHLCCSG